MPWNLVTDSEGNPVEANILAVHAALLPSNQVLIFGGSEHSFDRFSAFAGGIPLLKSQLFHLSSETLTNIGQSPDTDLFCAGHAFMGDGRLLAAGGTRDWPISFYGGVPDGDDNPNPHDTENHWDGEHACWVFNHWQGRWVRVRDLAFEPISGNPDHQEGGGRWYPTLITLADGSVIALSGHPGHQHTSHEAIHPEIYSAGKDEWETDPDHVMDFQYPVYPRGHLLPNGRVFFPSPDAGQQCGIYNTVDGNFEAVATLPAPENARISERDFTTVLLPLLPGNNYQAHILAANWAERALRFTIGDDDWDQAGNRNWSGDAPERINGCAVLLPTGQVALVGGVNRVEQDGELLQLDSGAVLRTEIYTPGINWSNEQYNFNNDEWETDPQSQSAQIPRNYHSGALLIPDGRIITVGSNNNANQGHPDDVAETRIEMYSPWYIDSDDRPSINDAPSSISYSQGFTINTTDAQNIQRVALMRLGSVTHSFDADQRYVGLQILNRTNNTLSVRSPPSGEIAPPGYYMLWIINEDDLPCEQASFIKLGHQGMFFVLDRSSISVHDVKSMLASGNGTFQQAIYVVMQGVAPNDFTPPTLTLTMDTGVGETAEDFDITAPLADILYDIGQHEGDTAQRITFVYSLRFSSANVFDSFDEMRNIHLRAESGAAETQAVIQLHKQPNPFMIDGEEFWLSTDLRVFKVIEDKYSPPGLPSFDTNRNPLDYLQELIDDFDAHNGGSHPFDSIPEAQDESKLELARSIPDFGFPWPWPFDEDRRVYNFAIARVRYRSLATSAPNVRVFFRMFNTVGTALEYDTDGTYRRDGDGSNATPLLGKDGNVILSIPYFGSPRRDYTVDGMDEQGDPLNRKTLDPTGGQESSTYFGCWLDFNQTTPRLPLRPDNDGPFNGNLLSLQQLTRGYHQCLVSEIHFGTDLIPDGTTPSRSDKLSQRNIWIEEAPNPGISADSRVVFTTCELQSTRTAPVTLSSVTAAGQLDELMIQWHNLPRDSQVTLYLPSVEAADIVSEVAIYHGGPVLRRMDDHTLELRVADVTYIPIPRLPYRTIPGLLRVQLPEGITKGQVFNIQGQQFSDLGRPRNAPREILGGFQLTIPVYTSADVLPRLIYRYSVLKHVALSIPEDDRWYPIFQRYLDGTGDRLVGLGQDPNEIEPSPDGTGRKPDVPDKPDPCATDTDRPVPCKPDAELGSPVVGKVDRLIYDCYGDFIGFVIDCCPGERVFNTRDKKIHRLIRKACVKRRRLTIMPFKHQPSSIYRVEFHC